MGSSVLTLALLVRLCNEFDPSCPRPVCPDHGIDAAHFRDDTEPFVVQAHNKGHIVLIWFVFSFFTSYSKQGPRSHFAVNSRATHDRFFATALLRSPHKIGPGDSIFHTSSVSGRHKTNPEGSGCEDGRLKKVSGQPF